MAFKRLIAGCGVSVALFMLVTQVYAQQKGGSGLSISPTRTEMTVEKGKADVVHLSLKNISGINVTAKAVINDFEPDNVTGEPKIIIDPKVQSPATIKKFLIGVTDIELKKDETKNFDIPVQIPADTVSGAYYGVIRYTAIPTDRKEAGRQVALNASLGTLILIQVPGNITERVQAERIAVERDGRTGSLFIGSPTRTDVTVKNTGNGFSKPFGHVIVSNMHGKEVFSYEMNNTDPRSNVLPGASRVFKDDIKNVNRLGRYTVVANISYGRGGEILTLKTSFWVFPLWFVIVAFVVLLVIGAAGFFTYRRLAKRNHRRHR